MLGRSTESPGANTSRHGPYAVPGVRASTSTEDESPNARRMREAPTTIAPGELAGAMRHAFISTFPAETTTGIPASSSDATALSSAGMFVDVSAMNDQFAIAR